VTAAAGPSGGLTEGPPWAHDPFLVREGAYYYLFSTGQGILVQRSRDLHTWEALQTVFSKRPAWLVQGLSGFIGDIWAPEASWHDGLWRLYYCASSFGTNHSRIGYATNRTLDPASPDFAWVDHGEVVASEPGRDDWNAIDPSLVVDDSGRWFLTFGSFWSGIKQMELDPGTGKPRSSPPALRSLASRPGVPNDPIEAPFISRHGGYWYLWVSIDYCCQGVRSDYKVAVGRSAEATGPFADEQGEDMREGGATIVLQGYGDVHGPGGESVLHDGDRDLLVHHMYDGTLAGEAVMQARPIQWVDGWPRIGTPLP
jgi:arabinan endo-1,5-alpha-L-arabinosidase